MGVEEFCYAGTQSFTVKVRAVGGDIVFGTVASKTPMFPRTAWFTYLRSVYGSSRVLHVASSTDFAVPTGVITTGLDNSFILSENTEAIIPVTFVFISRREDGMNALPNQDTVAVGLIHASWTAREGGHPTGTSFGSTWRTDSVPFP